MKIKKTPKSNLENYSKIFMQLGLVLALFITYATVKKKTFDPQFSDLGNVTMNASFEERMSIREQIEPEILSPLALKKIKVVEGIFYTITERIPTFPGCDENDKDCFNKKMQMHFIKNFNKDLTKKAGLKPGKKRIDMHFQINKKGRVSDINVKVPNKKLKEEGIRIIKMLPKMIPGQQDGKPVAVKYTLSMQIEVK